MKSLKEHFKQRLLEELMESRQSEERQLMARVGKRRPRDTREYDPSRVTLAGMGAGIDPLNRAKQREMSADLADSQRYPNIFGKARARNIRTDASIRIMGSSY